MTQDIQKVGMCHTELDRDRGVARLITRHDGLDHVLELDKPMLGLVIGELIHRLDQLEPRPDALQLTDVELEVLARKLRQEAIRCGDSGAVAIRDVIEEIEQKIRAVRDKQASHDRED